MRFARLITWICTACLAGVAAVYGFAFIHMLWSGHIAEFSKVPTGRSHKWADEPALVIVSAIGHATLLVLLVMLPIWTWQTLPSALARLQCSFRLMTDDQRAKLGMISLTLIATFAALSVGLPAGKMRGPVIATIWLLWLGACAQLPLQALKLGEVRSSTGKVFRHSDDPRGFWRCWAKMTAWCAVTLGLATMVCWAKW